MDREKLYRLLRLGIEKGASDIHFQVGYLPLYRFNGDLVELRYKILTEKDTEAIARILAESDDKKFDDFNELDLATLIFDYRGYGRSEGAASEQGIYRDAEAVWRHLTEERGIPAAEIVLFGRSLGAAVAASVASRHTPGALIIESGVVSVPDMAAKIYPWLPARWLARIGFPTGDYLRTTTCPVLVVHSRDDEIIPFDQGLRLFEVASEPKQFLELRGGHNDGFLVSGRRYLDGLDAFVAASLSK